MSSLRLASRPAVCRFLVAMVPLVILGGVCVAATPRVLPEGTLPDDQRLGALQTLNGYYPFVPPETPEQWKARAKELRRQLLVSQGLWPMPERTPANAVIHGRVQRDGYTVEKVYFESFPGHFVTGNLYRPEDDVERHPAVLCPHGHWANGRKFDHGLKKVRQEIVNGAERFVQGGRHPIQARCVQLARMGCVVFNYDMVGYADSVQLEHRAGVRESMNTPENWGYFSPRAESRLQTTMGLQTYNSIRALDWLSELPDVDPKRIGVTGASGGGTQTFILCALDPRPVVAFPAVMVSTAMQGGCTCENASYLRVGTGNVEIAALFAPRPLGMSAANDWTRELATKGLPELQRLYTMLGAPNNLLGRPFMHFGHNYNSVSRAVMYDWFNRHLALGFEPPILEEDYVPLSPDEISVWNDEHPRPQGGDDHERQLVRTINEISQRQIAALKPTNKKSLEEYRRVVGGALEVMVGGGVPEPEALEFENLFEESRGDYVEYRGLIRDTSAGVALPSVIFYPNQWNREVAIWIDPKGKAGLYNSSGDLRPGVRRLLDSGMAVIGADLLYQGEFLADGKPLEHAPMVGDAKQGREAYVGYTHGYNHSLVGRRVQDVLTLVSFAKNHEQTPEAVYLVGLNGAGHWVGLARAIAGDAVARTVVDTDGFRFANVEQLDDVDFLPGGAKYGDLPGLLALIAPHPMWLSGEGPSLPDMMEAAYQAAEANHGVTLFDGDPNAAERSAIEWLIQ